MEFAKENGMHILTLQACISDDGRFLPLAVSVRADPDVQEVAIQ